MESPPLEISCQELCARLAGDNPPLLVDCREAEEYELVAIADSVLVPLSQWEERSAELRPHVDRPIVVYCHFGARSLKATKRLRNQGFDSAQSLAGGIDAWAEHIEPGMTRY